MDIRTIKKAFLSRVSQEQVPEYESRFNMLLDDKYKYNRLDYLQAKAFPSEENSKLQKDLDSLISGIPVQYVIGHTLFAGLKLKTDPRALIPRPETEELITQSFERLTSRSRAVDLATGSGCIALALKSKFEKVYAIEKSRPALQLASENADSLNLDLNFIEDDILLSSQAWPLDLDLVISNPPYVRELEKGRMLPEVYNNEPNMALFVPDGDPLVFYKTIIKYAMEALKPKGLLAFEINQFLGREMKSLLDKYFERVEIVSDQFDNTRFAFAQQKRPV